MTRVDVSAGSVVVIDGAEWRVERGEPHTGRVHLAGADGGARQCVTFRFLAHHPDGHASSLTADGAGRGRQPKNMPAGHRGPRHYH